MHRIDSPNAVNGNFKNRDEFTRDPGTVVNAEWAQAVQDEIIAVILQAGFVLDKTKNTQLRDAITKFIDDLNMAIQSDLDKLFTKDSELSRAIKNLQDAIASMGGPITNYGTTTLVKRHTFTAPTGNNYYAAPHTNGFAIVTLNGATLSYGSDWVEANNGLGIELKSSFYPVSTNFSSELVITTFASGDLIKVISQLQVGMTTVWYGTEEDIPYGYIPLRGQLTAPYAQDYPLIITMFGTNFPDTRDVAKGSVNIIKGLELTDLGADYSNRYYGPGDVDPVVNMNGGIPIIGDVYYNTIFKKLFYYDGDIWSAMDQILISYTMVDDTLPSKNLNKSTSKYGIKSNGKWILPSTVNMTVGDVIEIRAFDTFAPTIEVSNTALEKINFAGSLITLMQLNQRSTVKFVYTGNKTYEMDDPLMDLRAEVMNAFVSYTTPIFVNPGDNLHIDHNCTIIFNGAATVTLGENATNISARLNFMVDVNLDECIITSLTGNIPFYSQNGSATSIKLKEKHAQYDIYRNTNVYTVIF